MRSVNQRSLLSEFCIASHVHTLCVDFSVMDQDLCALSLHHFDLELRVAHILRIGLRHHNRRLKHSLLQVFVGVLATAHILLQDHLNVDLREVHDVLR